MALNGPGGRVKSYDEKAKDRQRQHKKKRSIEEGPEFKGGVNDEPTSSRPEPPQGQNVDHPSHYNSGNIEVIDAIEDWKLGFHLGNAIKYIARADHKGKRQEDLEKALWYIQRELERYK